MTDIIISFDTEDFTSNRAADAILAEAQILHSLGIRGCFCIVGLLARQLVKWGRTDVLDALKHHEIAFHTYAHSLHPTINEYTDIEDFEIAKAELIKQESLGIQYVKEATGVDKIYSACPPGTSNTYVAMYAYEEMGIPLYAGTFCDTNDGDGVFYCNTYHMDYTFAMEKICFDMTDEKADELIEFFAKKKRVIFYTHPNMAIFTNFWDKVNYFGENKAEFGKWEFAPERAPEETERFYSNIRKILTKLKNDGRFNFTTYKEVYEKLSAMPPRVIKKSDASKILKSLKKELFPVDRFSLYDLTLAAKAFSLGDTEYECKKSYGLLYAPYELKKSVTLSREGIYSALKEIEYGKFLPAKITVDGQDIGPADLLIAAYEAILGAEEILVEPKKQLPCLDILPKTRDCSLKGSWIHSKDFNDDYLSERLRLQSYTMYF